MAPQQSRFRWLRLWTDYALGFDYRNQVGGIKSKASKTDHVIRHRNKDGGRSCIHLRNLASDGRWSSLVDLDS